MDEEIPEPNIHKFTLEDKKTQEDLAPWTSFSTKLAQKENAKKEDTWTPPKIVPLELHKYLDVFDKEKVKQFPKSRWWGVNVYELEFMHFTPSYLLKIYQLCSKLIQWGSLVLTTPDD